MLVAMVTQLGAITKSWTACLTKLMWLFLWD